MTNEDIINTPFLEPFYTLTTEEKKINLQKNIFLILPSILTYNSVSLRFDQWEYDEQILSQNWPWGYDEQNL